MAASQQHGFVFEQHVHQEVDRRLGPASRPPPAFQAEHTARFDLPAWRDPTGQGIPTSIKIAQRPRSNRVRVDLADARRTVALSEVPMLRLLVGIYGQRGTDKVVDEVREYLIPGDCWAQAAGDVPVDMVSRFHESLKQGHYQQARERARQWKKTLAQHYPGIIRWSPKIDSKTQRRLQCSVYLNELDALVADHPGASVRVYASAPVAPPVPPCSDCLWGAGGQALPLVIPSPPRARHAKDQAQAS